jgi:hypothetical protein
MKERRGWMTRRKLAMCAGGTLLAGFASGFTSPASRAAPSTGMPAPATAPTSAQRLNGGPRPSSVPMDTDPADPPVVITSENHARYTGLVANKLPGTWAFSQIRHYLGTKGHFLAHRR